MTTQTVRLSTIERVQSFTAAMGEFGFEVDLSSGRYIVNGKSIMGILSLDLGHPITVTAEVPEDQRERFLQVLQSFA